MKGAVSNDIRIDWNSCSHLYWSREIRHETGDCTFEIRNYIRKKHEAWSEHSGPCFFVFFER